MTDDAGQHLDGNVNAMLGGLVHATFHFDVEGMAGRVIVIIVFVVFLFLAVKVNVDTLGAKQNDDMLLEKVAFEHFVQAQLQDCLKFSCVAIVEGTNCPPDLD